MGSGTAEPQPCASAGVLRAWRRRPLPGAYLSGLPTQLHARMACKGGDDDVDGLRIRRRPESAGQRGDLRATWASSSHLFDDEQEGCVAIDDNAVLREHLQQLGGAASLELSPAQTLSPKLKYTLAAALDESPELLPAGTACFVNMVKKSRAHFEEVAAAARALRQRGMVAIPHLPASRFDSGAQLHETLEQLSSAGCTELLLLGALLLLLLLGTLLLLVLSGRCCCDCCRRPGGNDQHERAVSGAACFASAGELLAHDSATALQQHGFRHVVLAGHPEGHPGLGKDAEATTAMLAAKVSTAVAAGHTVSVASQFCFDTTTLISWLERTRTAVGEAVAAAGGRAAGSVRYFVGVPGPTRVSKLQRIAEICEVPSLFLGSAFDILDLDGDGEVTEPELLAAAATLHVEPAQLSQLYRKYSGADKVRSCALLMMIYNICIITPDV
jgi:5,10-methylenetetrahydrofolate reductase